MNGYLDPLPQANSETGLNEYIAPRFWKKEGAGLVGALALAQVAYEEGSSCTSEDMDIDASNKKAMGEIQIEPIGESLAEEGKSCGESLSRCPMKALSVYPGIFALGAVIGMRIRK